MNRFLLFAQRVLVCAFLFPALGPAAQAAAASSGFAVKLKPGLDAQRAAAHIVAATPLLSARSRSLGGRWIHLAPARTLTPQQAAQTARALRRNPRIEAVLEDRRDALAALPDDTLYTAEQWWLGGASTGSGGVANFPSAWDRSTGAPTSGLGPVVAVLDSGSTPHPELDARWVGAGHDFVSDAAYANDGNGRDNDPRDPGDRLSAAEAASNIALWDGCETRERSSWHGTLMAGQIGAVTNNRAGVAAINWNARLLSVRVAGKCGAAVTDVVDGMRWAAGLPVAGVALNPQPARIVVVGVAGFEACDPAHPDANIAAAAQLYIDTLAEVRAAGTLVVAAAGNQRARVGRPASCTGAFAVTALNRQGFKANYANYGSQIALATVGGDADRGATCDSQLADTGIVSTSNDGAGAIGRFAYAAGSGTSFAAPSVAGVASLMWALNPALTLAQVEAGLRGTARPHVQVPILQACDALGNFGRCQCATESCGAGILDAPEALAYAADPAVYRATPRPAITLDSPAIRQCAGLLGLPQPAVTPIAPTVPTPTPTPETPAAAAGGGALDAGWLIALLVAVLLLSAPRNRVRQVSGITTSPRASIGQ